MSKRYRVIVTPMAKKTLDIHADYLSQVSEHAALRLVEEFRQKAKSLEEMPERNPEYPYAPSGYPLYRKMLLMRRYLMLYTIEGDTVYIDYTIDCRQDNSWLML